NVQRRAEHREAGPVLGGARDAVTHPRLTAAEEALGFGLHGRCFPLLLLAFFAADRLGAVLDALALIRLGLAHAAQLRRSLADTLAVGASDLDRGRLLAGDLDVLRDREIDLMAEPELQIEGLALHRRAIPDAVDLEP